MPQALKGNAKTGPPSDWWRARRDALDCLTQQERNALLLARRQSRAPGWEVAVARALGLGRITRVKRWRFDGEEVAEAEVQSWVRDAVEEELQRIRAKVEAHARRLAACNDHPKEDKVEEHEYEYDLNAARIALQTQLEIIDEKLAKFKALAEARARVTAALDALDGGPAAPEPEPDPEEKLDEKVVDEPPPSDAPIEEKTESGRRKPQRVAGARKGDAYAHPTAEEVRDCVVMHFKDTKFVPRSIVSLIGGTAPTVKRRLEVLEKRGIVTHTGKGPTTRYTYVQPDPSQNPRSRPRGSNGGPPDDVSGRDAPRRGMPVPGTGIGTGVGRIPR